MNLLLITPSNHANNFSEAQIKAVFLFNFSNFIRWPESVFANADTPFYFCSLTDQTPIIQSLIQVINGESFQGRKLTFKLIKPQNNSTINTVKACQILFIHQHELGQFTTLAQSISEINVLTVSDADDFINKGGMITLTHSNRRLRPIINNRRLQKAGLKASSKLLQLAEIIE